MFERLKNYINPPLPDETLETVSCLSITMKDGKMLSWESTGIPEGYEAGSYHPDGPWREFYDWFGRAAEDSFYHFLSSGGNTLSMFRKGDIVRITEHIRTDFV